MITSSPHTAHSNGLMPGDRLADFDFDAHNAEVREMWAAYHAGNPYRTPVIAGTSTRFFLFNPGANPAKLEFKDYIENPDVMFDAQLRFQRWRRFNLLQDQELGLPDKWMVTVDFQNFAESAFFGCAVEYINGEVPDTMPAFGDAPERIMEGGIPNPFGGIMAKALSHFEHFKKRAARETFLGRPIEVKYGVWTDGPFTIACNLFGPDVACLMMAEEPDRMNALLDFITAATIDRIRAWCGVFEMAAPQPGLAYADDSVAMISTEMCREFIVPQHRKFCAAFGDSGPRNIHLCGDSTRHFAMLRDELNIRGFDTGFPVNFGRLRQELGPQVNIQGGPHIEMMLSSTPERIRAEVRRIMESGVLEGGLFTLREGNNLAPGTPLENVEAMYHAGREFGLRR
ncbi:MAG: uroporphyrinogen decarboxylase family protein [Terrimicrobiaceae bacterium]